MWQTYHDWEENRTWCILVQLLTQAEESRSSELPSLRRELNRWNNGVVALSHLGETSSLERDGLSLKTGACRLSDSSRNTWEGFLRLGELYSLGRDYQISSTVHAGQYTDSSRTIWNTHLYHIEHHIHTINTKQN